jgi:glycosyltransferase involved in cell wall biosynthesis
MDKILISVVVTTYNRGNILKYCLDCLADQTIDKSLYEVVVVNNNSTDNTQQIVDDYVKKFYNFKAVLETKQGSAHARNRGWQEAKGGIIAYIDDDAKTTKDWCEKILKDFNTITPKPVAIGGRVFPWYEGTPPRWFADEFEIRTWGKDARFLKEKECFVTMNTAIRKEMFEKYGGFNIEYGPVYDIPRMGDDTEFFYRIFNKEPFLWYDPELVVLHWTPKNRMKISYRFNRSMKNGEATAKMHQRKILSLNYIKYSFGLVYFLLRSPFIVILSSKNKATQLVLELEKIGYMMGYLNIKKQ